MRVLGNSLSLPVFGGFLAILLLLTLSSHPALAERGIMDVAQPISLLGTEGEDDPLRDGQWLPATILTRPSVIAGAYPEDVVAAMCAPHRIALAPRNFPRESNLLVLVGARLRVEWAGDSPVIIADFSRAQTPEHLGLTIPQVMQLTAECLRRNLRHPAPAPITVRWQAPPGDRAILSQLPRTITPAQGP